MGADLEQGAYHAIPDDEAPVLGNAPPAKLTCGEVLVLVKALVLRIASVALTALVIAVVILLPLYMPPAPKKPAFSIGLAGYEGIDVARPGSVVSPAFNLTLRVSNTCADRAEVVLTYSGVALGWTRVEPRGCMSCEPSGRDDVEVVARANGVRLSRRLRERMASDWHCSGRLELDADVVIYMDRGPPDYFGYDKVMRCKVVVTADGLQPEPKSCTWYFLRPYNYDVNSVLNL